MSLVVKYTIVHEKTQRVTFRRTFPLDVREITGWAYKVPLGIEGSPGLLSRWEKAASGYEAALDRARKQLAGKHDQLDFPIIAYLAETFRVDLIAADEAGRWSGEERELYEATAADLRERDVEAVGAWDGNEGVRWAQKARETLAWTLLRYKDLRANGDLKGIVELWQSDAEDLLEAKGLIVSLDAHK